MDALAVAYARELTRWGIETSIVVPGAFTKGTNHFANASAPDDKARLADYEDGPFHGFGEQVKTAFASIAPEDADVGTVADAMVAIVDSPRGKRTFRIGVDPTNDGSMVVNQCSTVFAKRCCEGWASEICLRYLEMLRPAHHRTWKEC